MRTCVSLAVSLIRAQAGREPDEMTAPRVALVGLKLESNRFSRPAEMDDFLSLNLLEGEALLEEARKPTPSLAKEISAFVSAMDATGDWVPVPTLLAASHPLGPIRKDVFEEFCDKILGALDDSLDAVYLCLHGAMVAEHLDDPDGEVLTRIRSKVGADAPIVITLDLHANISDRMCSAVDLVCGYRTNPHVDMTERGQEAAFSLRRILAGQARPQVAHVKLPLAPASVTLLTAKAPYGDLIDFGQRRQAELSGAIMNVSVFGNFIFSDVPENGISVVVTATTDREVALTLATEIAEIAWARRHEFLRDLTSIPDAVDMALDRNRPALIFSEAGDNPGGGGSGRTTELLAALIAASARDVFYGSFFDPELAADAHGVGGGATLTARFNRGRGDQAWERWDEPLEVEAEVVGLSDGDVVGRRGMLEGRRMYLGKSALLRIGGIHVVVISDRAQTSDPMFFEMFGLNVADAHTVIVKSRGHFRAGFDIWFSHEQTFEIDTAGLTSPVLDRWNFTRIPRPSFPFDRDADWAANGSP